MHGVAVELCDHVGDTEAPGLDFEAFLLEVAYQAGRDSTALESRCELFAVRRYAGRKLVSLEIVARDAHGVEMPVASAQQDALAEPIQAATAGRGNCDRSFV